jgi:hypothetical protein
VTQDSEITALVDVLLTLLPRQPITAPDADAGIDILVTMVGSCATPNNWRAAVAAALAAGYIYEPVTLPLGALHCHWRLELTPHGFEAAARLR